MNVTIIEGDIAVDPSESKEEKPSYKWENGVVPYTFYDSGLNGLG